MAVYIYIKHRRFSGVHPLPCNGSTVESESVVEIRHKFVHIHSRLVTKEVGRNLWGNCKQVFKGRLPKKKSVFL